MGKRLQFSAKDNSDRRRRRLLRLSEGKKEGRPMADLHLARVSSAGGIIKVPLGPFIIQLSLQGSLCTSVYITFKPKIQNSHHKIGLFGVWVCTISGMFQSTYNYAKMIAARYLQIMTLFSHRYPTLPSNLKLTCVVILADCNWLSNYCFQHLTLPIGPIQ